MSGGRTSLNSLDIQSLTLGIGLSLAIALSVVGLAYTISSRQDVKLHEVTLGIMCEKLESSSSVHSVYKGESTKIMGGAREAYIGTFDNRQYVKLELYKYNKLVDTVILVLSDGIYKFSCKNYF